MRLSLPGPKSPDTGLDELSVPGSTDRLALIREVHVYGQSLPLGDEQQGAAQHAGLGTQLLQAAEAAAREHGYARVAVIAAVGTRRYYLDRGYERGDLYLTKRFA